MQWKLRNNSKRFNLDPGNLTFADIKRLINKDVTLRLQESSYAKIKDSQQTLKNILETDEVIYGVNTGFGKLASTKISQTQLEQLQRNLVLSHCAGVGEFLSDEIIQLTLILKINSLAQGYSGVSANLIDAIIALYNKQVYPLIPEKGSVGACGDLAPLAHLAAILIGEGEARYKEKKIPAKKALAKAGLKIMVLAPKEGLALVNGAQISTAIGLTAVIKTKNIFDAAIISGCLSIDAVNANIIPFDERIHQLSQHKTQAICADLYRKWLAGSEIAASVNKHRVQDPYSLRCQPQVMGACLKQINVTEETLMDEANTVSDNPLIFPKEQKILAGGNFHAEAVAMACDNLALAISEIGGLAERRIALLMDANQSGLPAFLANDSGLNSGFMLAQVSAAALASENKSLAHPASVDSIPTSVNQEDHVSMATFSARRLESMIDNTANILAIELLAASQGLTFRQPQKTSKALQQVIRQIRELVPAYYQDSIMSDDIAKVKQLILNDKFYSLSNY